MTRTPSRPGPDPDGGSREAVGEPPPSRRNPKIVDHRTLTSTSEGLLSAVRPRV